MIATMRPNILFLQADQLRADALGFSSGGVVHTPHLDALAARSVVFENCFVQSPVCMPSRASMFTGCYPSTLRLQHMGVPVPEDIPTLSHLLEKSGYHTAHIGKLHFLPHGNRDHREPHPSYGYQHLLVSDEPGPYEDAYRAWVRQNFPDALDHISLGLSPKAKVWRTTLGLQDNIQHFSARQMKGAQAFPGPDEATHSAFVAANAVEFLQRHPQEPFFLTASFFAPHSPMVAPQRFLDLYPPEKLELPNYPEGWFMPPDSPCQDPALIRSLKQGYFAMISEVDEKIGQILTALDQAGLTERTVIVFTSDHGEWLGQRGKFGKGYPADDAISRVPLLVAFPGQRPPAQHITDIVEGVDILPTLLEAAGVQSPPCLQGESLRSMLKGGHRRNPDALTEGRGWKALRTPEYRYLVHEDGREMLFRSCDDRGDDYDIAGQSPEIVAEMRARLIQKLLTIERPRPRQWTY